MLAITNNSTSGLGQLRVASIGEKLMAVQCWNCYCRIVYCSSFVITLLSQTLSYNVTLEVDN